MIPLVVRGLERGGNLSSDRQRFARGDCTPRQSGGKRLALDQLQYQSAHAADVGHAVNRSDVRMIERGEHARFAFEQGAALRIRGEGWRQDFYRNVSSECVVVRSIDFTHAADAEQRAECIAAKMAAD